MILIAGQIYKNRLELAGRFVVIMNGVCQACYLILKSRVQMAMIHSTRRKTFKFTFGLLKCQSKV